MGSELKGTEEAEVDEDEGGDGDGDGDGEEDAGNGEQDGLPTVNTKLNAVNNMTAWRGPRPHLVYDKTSAPHAFARRRWHFWLCTQLGNEQALGSSNALLVHLGP